MNQSTNNKRIAKNSIFLYLRQILIMAVSLYTVRVTLEVLGEEDYGIYNAVGGFVAMFSILSGAMSIAIARFITYEKGQPNVTTFRVQQIFSASLLIQVGMGIAVCLLISTFGVWFIENKMVIPFERLDVAFYVLWFSALAFFINLLSVPYNALIIANEQMKAFAYISIVEAVLKLAVVGLLIIIPLDKLWLYALFMVVVALIQRSIYAIYCKRHFTECRFVMAFDKKLLFRMFAFSGWAFLGNGVIVLKDQGSNVLLNLFGGPVVNAAQGIAMRVNTSVYSFVANFMQASNPQITKNYAAGNLDEMHTLIIRSGKFGFFILLIVLLPLCVDINYVLGLWLSDVPAHTANFIVLVLLYSLVDCWVNPLCTGVLAQGNIKSYEIVLTFIYLVNFIASYVCLRDGLPVETVFVLNIVFKVCVLFALLLHSRSKYGLSIVRFFKSCLIPSLVVFSVSALFVFALLGKEASDFGLFFMRTLVITVFTSVTVYALGMTRTERFYIKKILKEKWHGIYSQIQR